MFARVADALAAPSGAQGTPRPLTPRERALLLRVFGGALDLERIEIVPAVSLNTWTPREGYLPRAIGDRIYWPSRGMFAEWMSEDGVTADGESTLIHEAAHVAQHQHGGLAYMGDSLACQLSGILRGRGRSAAYDWVQAARSGVPWQHLGAEQQARLIEEAFTSSVSYFDRSDLSEYVAHAVEEARAGRGWCG